jgi:hypothetical protein
LRFRLVGVEKRWASYLLLLRAISVELQQLIGGVEKESDLRLLQQKLDSLRTGVQGQFFGGVMTTAVGEVPFVGVFKATLCILLVYKSTTMNY